MNRHLEAHVNVRLVQSIDTTTSATILFHSWYVSNRKLFALLCCFVSMQTALEKKKKKRKRNQASSNLVFVIEQTKIIIGCWKTGF
jgi:hypothetical protein